MKRLSQILCLIFGAVLLTACSQHPFSPRNEYGSLTTPVQETSIIAWANEAAISAYTYNFASYQKDFQKTSAYFTPKAWREFLSALKHSGNLETVIKKKLVISAVTTNKSHILEEGVKEGTYTWVVQVPLEVQYQSAFHNQKHPVLVTMTIERTPPHNGNKYLGITQFASK